VPILQFDFYYARGAVAKYCNERVCVCVCLSVCLRAYLPNHTRDIYQFLCMLPIAVARSSGGVTKSRGEGAILGVFYPTDNTLYSIAFGTHTKTTEPIEMPFRLMTRAGPRYHVLDGDPIPGESAICFLGGVA